MEKSLKNQISLRKCLSAYKPFIYNTEQLKGIIQGFYNGIFECGQKEMDFPKYKWFDEWMQGKFRNKLSLIEQLHSLAPNKPDLQVSFFFKYYEEFSSASATSIVQRVKKKQKIHNDKLGIGWSRISNETNKLIVFTLSGSKQTWCLLLHDDYILHTTSAPDKRSIFIYIKKSYFKLDSNWKEIKSKNYLRNLILKAQNNY
ncbi:MAG TPA: hypothetical protein DHV26_09135 [Cytophagales bacterium]|nr:hypothetical protein [Cytophagales bacterium]HRG09042.1 hypothetical protein [Cyclobacteriaceae bacterium]